MTDCAITGHHIHLSRTHMVNLRRHDVASMPEHTPITRLLGVPVFVKDCAEPIEHNRPDTWAPGSGAYVDHVLGWATPRVF